MPIERKNSFHLMLSDDELELLRLLAEREGLNASDYLRTILRRLAGPPPHLAAALRLSDLLADKKIDVRRYTMPAAAAASASASAAPAPARAPKTKKRRK
jgi:hypothetical protein